VLTIHILFDSAEGYADFCCVRAGSCGEQNCPNFCAFVEGCCCNCIAVSVNRTYLMDQYDLSSDPCDYRLIRINNCMQMFSCVCNLLALFVEDLRELARYSRSSSANFLLSTYIFFCFSEQTDRPRGRPVLPLCLRLHDGAGTVYVYCTKRICNSA